MSQSPPGEPNQDCFGDAPPSPKQRLEFLMKLGIGPFKNSIRAMMVIGFVICLAGWGALSILYHVAINFVHPDSAFCLCIAIGFGCTALMLLILRQQKPSKGAIDLNKLALSEEPRCFRIWTKSKAWALLVLTLFVGVPLVRSLRSLLSADDSDMRIVFGIAMPSIYLLFWMLASRVERFLIQRASPNAAAVTRQDDWKSAPWLAIGFCTWALLSPQSSGKRPTQGWQNKIGVVPISRDGVTPWNQKRQATSAYWQIAVASLHEIRFQTPSGQEPAEKFYERMFQQLRLQTDAAGLASTANVDSQLVQMATRHLMVEGQFLEMKQKLDEFMQRQQIPSPADTVDQRMAMTQLLLGILQTSPEALEKLPAGPEREWIEKGLVLEQLRQDQFREIEIMQAVLQERYEGTTFPLPAVQP